MVNLVGVVGKPNVGKSTFFSAATLISVPIANYPFTTIKPNRGMGYVRTQCVCKEFGVQDEPVTASCSNGIRLIPVELVDCAGLVPGAWQGRGLGNQFLDEIQRADALVNVIDTSGSTDFEGKQCPPGTHDPLDDVEFLNKEIDMWWFQIIKKDWETVARKAENEREDISVALERRLAGLAIKRGQVSKAIMSSDLDHKKPTSWDDNELLKLTLEMRKISKPMVIAANKIDLPHAEENLERMRNAKLDVIPCCAEAELALRRAAEKKLADYRPGDSSFKILQSETMTTDQIRALSTIEEKILRRWGSTGVQDVIDHSYLRLLSMIVVYPVENPEKLTDHRGRVLPDSYLVPQGTTARQFASIIHSDLGEGFIYAIEARSKMRVGEDYVLKDKDVISIVSAKKRG